MDKRGVESILRILNSMNDLAIKLDKSYEKGDSEESAVLKRKILELQRKVDSML